MRQTKAEKALDLQIERIYGQRCNGVQIPMMAIAGVFKAGRLAAKEGRDIEQAIVDFVATVAEPKK